MKNKSYNHISHLIERYPELSDVEENIRLAIVTVLHSIVNGGTLLICGNGGSSADSEHIVGELMKGFIIDRPIPNNIKINLSNMYPDDAEYLFKNLQSGIRSISLTSHSALTSAFSNDNASDLIFAQQVLGYGRLGDVLLAISTSGNSKNIVYAAKIAKSMDMKVIALTGNTGGELKFYSDIIINVPEQETYKIQEYHLPVYHCICLALENELFGDE